MPDPVLLAVDDDRGVLRAIGADLRRQYGAHYRVLSADSGAAALDALQQLTLRDEAVALLLVDQRMPAMTGVEFLEQALKLFPDAKRVLLTAYADTNAAISAINAAKIDYYLLKPWDPPEERLYPVLTDLLDDWQASHRSPFGGVRVLGHRWSPASHEIKAFLARNHVPYQWVDIEEDGKARNLLEQSGADLGALPVVFLADGRQLTNPTTEELAEQIGLRMHAERPFYDLIIVGAGPAGLAAAVYGASEGLHTLMIECSAPGGQAGSSSRIENYLGFPVGLSGGDLARRAVAQARRFGVEILTPQRVVAVRTDGPYRIVKLKDGSELSCHALVIATGVSYRTLDVPGVDRLTGKGVYYGATLTEALEQRDRDVYIVGGANSAGQSAVYFAKYARRVTILVRGASLAEGMSRYLVDQIEATRNISVRTRCSVLEVSGESSLQSITLLDAVTGDREKVPADALLVFIGAMPNTEWLEGVLARDKHGFILTGSDLLVTNGDRPVWSHDRDPYFLEASIPGVFVAGDVRHGATRRVASGVGEGAIAVQLVHEYLRKIV